MTTPIPVPIHSLLEATNIAVILIHDNCGLSEPIDIKTSLKIQ